MEADIPLKFIDIYFGLAGNERSIYADIDNMRCCPASVLLDRKGGRQPYRKFGLCPLQASMHHKNNEMKTKIRNGTK
jgi:hypothetical protein